MDQPIHFLKASAKVSYFIESDLPALIHYKPKEGGSNYSMVLIENLVLRGSKAIILTGFLEAKTQYFREATKIIEQTATIETINDIEKYKDKQVLIIHDDDEELCRKLITTLKDIDERIIFIKNIDIFHEPLIQEALKYNKLILSGDLDSCSSKNMITKKTFTSTILFSQPETKIMQTFTPLQPYIGQIRSKNTQGYVACTNET